MARLASILAACLLSACMSARTACVPPGRWADPASLRFVADSLAGAWQRRVTLLGEQHDSAADHAWQLETISRLYTADPSLVLGFEMFPRSGQLVLDRWVRGELSEDAFLTQSDWHHFWGFPPALYMPIFRFARDHRIPMRALNVSHALVHRTSQSGWAAIPPREREGVGTPASPSADYRKSLQDVMNGHGGPSITPARLAHFVDAQLLWDRAMAEGIVAARTAYAGRPVVALMGAGHVEDRHGVPHQLDALGLKGALVLIPVDEACTPPGQGYADAIYVTGPSAPTPPATVPRS